VRWQVIADCDDPLPRIAEAQWLSNMAVRKSSTVTTPWGGSPLPRLPQTWWSTLQDSLHGQDILERKAHDETDALRDVVDTLRAVW